VFGGVAPVTDKRYLFTSAGAVRMYTGSDMKWGAQNTGILWKQKKNEKRGPEYCGKSLHMQATSWAWRGSTSSIGLQVYNHFYVHKGVNMPRLVEAALYIANLHFLLKLIFTENYIIHYFLLFSLFSATQEYYFPAGTRRHEWSHTHTMAGGDTTTRVSEPDTSEPDTPGSPDLLMRGVCSRALACSLFAFIPLILLSSSSRRRGRAVVG